MSNEIVCSESDLNRYFKQRETIKGFDPKFELLQEIQRNIEKKIFLSLMTKKYNQYIENQLKQILNVSNMHEY